MKAQFNIKILAFVIIASGCALAFVTAVVPHYQAGHKLLAGVFIASLIPYIIYAALLEVFRDTALITAGVLIFAIDLLLKLSLRFFSHEMTDGTTLMYASFTLAIIPLGVLLWTSLSLFGGRKD